LSGPHGNNDVLQIGEHHLLTTPSVLIPGQET
jgi:hypothetical protein